MKLTKDRIVIRATVLETLEDLKTKSVKLLPDLIRDCPEFYEWSRDIIWDFQEPLDFVLIDTQKHEEDLNRTYIIAIFTNTQTFQIHVTPPSAKDDDGYLTAYSGLRKPRAGTELTELGGIWGGSDELADGPYSKETWISVLNDIVTREMVKVGWADFPCEEFPVCEDE